MSMEFGKLNFAVGFNRTSAFPLDANSYFESYDDAVNAAKGAAEVGSADSAYYIGQLLIIKDGKAGVGLYQIGADKTLTKFGQASSTEELASKVSALETRCTNIEGKLVLATTETNGLRSKEDKAKLDGVDALTNRVTTAEGNIKTNSDNITAIQGKLSGLTGARHFVGTSTTDPASDGGATIEGVDSFKSGDVCLFGKKEFVCVVTTTGDQTTTKWIELGDEGSYATKDSVATDIAAAKSALTTDYDTKLGKKVNISQVVSVSGDSTASTQIYSGGKTDAQIEAKVNPVAADVEKLKAPIVSASALAAGVAPTVSVSTIADGENAGKLSFAFGIPAGADGKAGANGANGHNIFVATTDVQSDTDVNKTDIVNSTSIAVGDTIFDNNGDAYTVTAVADSTVHVSNAIAGFNIKGKDGAAGQNGTAATLNAGTFTVDGSANAGITRGGTENARTIDIVLPAITGAEFNADGQLVFTTNIPDLAKN